MKLKGTGISSKMLVTKIFSDNRFFTDLLKGHFKMKIYRECCFLIMLALSHVPSKAQYHKEGSAFFMGNFKDEFGTLPDSLQVFYLKDYVYNQTGIVKFSVYPNKERQFTFSLSDLHYSARMFLVVYENGEEYKLNSNDYFIEPGDSIIITIEKVDGVTESNFLGKGFNKYLCQDQLHSLNKEFFKKWSSTRKVGGMAQWIRKLYDVVNTGVEDVSNLLLKYKGQISPEMCELLRVEYSSICKIQLDVQLGDLLKTQAANVKDTILNSYRTFVLPEKSVNESVAALSPNYIRHIVEKNGTALFFRTEGRGFTIKEFFDHMKTSNSGILREKLLLYFIFSSDFKYVGDYKPEDYDYCLTEAFAIIQSPYLKEVIKSKFVVKVGTPAYNFSLKDTEGNSVSLNDFKGKVVLLDVWSDGCGACIVFSKNFEKYVYPEFKNNKEFEVIGININISKDRWLTALNTGKYIDTKHINLNAPFNEGVSNEKHPFVDYYGIDTLPFLLLIDKNGRIHSKLAVTIKPAELTALIKDALVKHVKTP